MAQRLSCEERAWIEAMRAAGVSVEVTARRLGRHRSTVYRELDRNSRHGRYSAQAAQAAGAGSGGEAQDAQARRRSRPGGGGRAASVDGLVAARGVRGFARRGTRRVR